MSKFIFSNGVAYNANHISSVEIVDNDADNSNRKKSWKRYSVYVSILGDIDKKLAINTDSYEEAVAEQGRIIELLSE